MTVTLPPADVVAPACVDAEDPSYREQNTLGFDVSPRHGLGIDTIDVSGPVVPLTGLPRRMAPIEVRRPDGTMVPVQMRLGGWFGTPQLRASFSVATWHHGTNGRPGSTDEALAAVEQFHGASKHLVEWQAPWYELAVQRCDIARDFDGVANALQVLDGASRVPGNNVTTLLVRDRRCRGTETLYRTTRGWKARLYSREAAASKRAGQRPDGVEIERGRIRFEIELLPDHLERHHIAVADDLRSLDLGAVCEYYWLRCCFGAPVRVPATANVELGAIWAAALPAERRLIRDGIGNVLLERLGHEVPGSPTTRAKVAAVIKRYGLDSVEAAGSHLVRFDLHAGQLVSAT